MGDIMTDTMWHRDGRGGYKAVDAEHGVTARISRASSARRAGTWFVSTYLTVAKDYRDEVDHAYIRLLADAKRHAEQVMAMPCTHGRCTDADHDHEEEGAP